METRKVLTDAIESGEAITIKYQGGSKPGTVRQIAPTSFIGEDKVRAVCLASGRSKAFLIAKIELSANDHDKVDYETAPLPRMPESLAEALDSHLDSLRSLGWHVETDKECYSLHRYFKNGNPRKTAVVSIRFNEFTYSPAEVSVSLGFSFDSEGNLTISTGTGEDIDLADAEWVEVEDWDEGEDWDDEVLENDDDEDNEKEWSDEEWDEVDGGLIKKPAERPWVVRCEEAKYASAFKSLKNAAEKFIELGQELALS